MISLSIIYNEAKERLLGAQLSLTADTIRVALIGTDTDGSVVYTPNPDTDDATSGESFVSDVIGAEATEVSGTNYERKTLSTTPIQTDNSNDRAEFDADDITWSLLDTTRDIAGVLMYKQVGADDSTPGDDPLIGYFDGPDFPKPTNGSDFTIAWDADGIIHGI